MRIQESCLSVANIAIHRRVDTSCMSRLQPREQAGTDKGVRQILYTSGPEPKDRRRFDNGDQFQHVSGLAPERQVLQGCVP
jgi:hypothetical protein